MRKSFQTILLIWSLANIYPSLVSAQGVIEIHDYKQIKAITEQVMVFKDSTNQLQINDILKKKALLPFITNNTPILELSTTHKDKLQSTWVKFNLKNLSNDKVYLELDNIDIPYCEIYIPADSSSALSYKVKKIGIFVAENSKAIDLNYYLVSLLDAQNTANHTIYLRFQQKGIHHVRLRVGNLPLFFQRSHNIDVFYGIFFGIVFMTFFYNLFVYLSFRDKVYIWYSIYVISRGALTLANQGYGSNFFWGAIANYNEQIIVGIFHICILSYIVFSISFLDTAKHTPIWHRGLVGFIFSLLISFFVSWFNFYLVVIFWQVVAVIVFVYVFALSVYIYFQGNKTARFYLLANIFFVLGLFIIILRSNQIIPQNFITVNTYPFGVVLEIIFFFFALTDKIKALRDERKLVQAENLRLVHKQNEYLEQKVKERTKDLENANNEIISQNEELQQSHEQLNLLNEELLVQRNNLSEMNSHLEDLVAQKTQQLQLQNQQLADYAYFNSHKVRGALARVLGLCIILEQIQNEISRSELFDLVSKIFLSAKELDLFVKEINIILNRDLEKELNQFNQIQDE